MSDNGSTVFVYDADSNMTGRGVDTLSFDGWGRLSGGSFGGPTVGYEFDTAGFRRTRTSGASVTRYLLGNLFETNGSGTITTSYVDGPAGDLAAEADTSGARTANHTYDPFGQPLDTPPANATVHRYTGAWDKQHDTTTSLILMGARPYDPVLGRFLAVDPVEGGSANNYDYAGQDPVNAYDLTGEVVDAEFAGTGPCSLGIPVCSADGKDHVGPVRAPQWKTVAVIAVSVAVTSKVRAASVVAQTLGRPAAVAAKAAGRTIVVASVKLMNQQASEVVQCGTAAGYAWHARRSSTSGRVAAVAGLVSRCGPLVVRLSAAP